MRHIRVLFIFGIFYISMNLLNLHAQSHSLPVDLIVSVAPQGAFHNTLVKVNADTLALSEFYTNANSKGIIPVSWSPNGQILSIAQHLGAGSFQICVLNALGALQRCMSEQPFWGGNDEGESQFDAISWSEDSTEIYYVAESKETFRLVEADVLTGETTRVVFESAKTEKLPYGVLTWNITQQYVVIGNHFENPPYALGLELASLNPNVPQADQRRDVFSIVPRDEANRLCVRSSPNGNYFVMLAGVVGLMPNGYVPDATSIWLLNPEGQIVHRIQATPSTGEFAISTCPFWQADGQAVYFSAYNKDSSLVGLYRYTLTDRQLTTWYAAPSNSTTSGIVAPLSIYLDGQAIAGRTSASRMPPRKAQVGVVFADGYELTIAGDFEEYLYPVWVPPLP